MLPPPGGGRVVGVGGRSAVTYNCKRPPHLPDFSSTGRQQRAKNSPNSCRPVLGVQTVVQSAPQGRIQGVTILDGARSHPFPLERETIMLRRTSHLRLG